MAHDVHASADGRHTWTAEGGHCACGGGHATTPFEDMCPAAQPIVVLRCRCGDGASHAEKGAHCPQAEVDALATLEAGLPRVS